MRRLFNDDERWELYRRAGGKCQLCEMELHGIFEADHIVPFSKGGATSLSNGQVLCERCNGMKSDRYVSLPDCDITLRDWQKRAFGVFTKKFTDGEQNVLINATPGAGKTIFALYVAHSMMQSRHIDRVIIIVPTDELRRQWQDEAEKVFGINLASIFDQNESFAPDYHGIVTTYATIGKRYEKGVKPVRKLLNGRRSLAIVDEIHHVGEGLNWCIALEDTLRDCTMRLLITGTPFRSDRNRIPYIEYEPSDDGLISKADYSYSYGEALRGRVVRPALFQTFGGDISWFDDGRLVERSLDDKLNGKDAATRLRMALRTDGDWLTSVLVDANSKLDEMRKTDHRAGGLIVAKDTAHAWAISQVMNEFGVHPVVVTSLQENGEPDPTASEKLSAYRHSSTPWVIAVRMVSEGIDIKRLRIGVWATTVQTEMFFRQVLGRILRVDSEGVEEQYAIQYIPKTEPYTTFAETIKADVKHQIIDDLDSIEDEREKLRQMSAEWQTYNGAQFVSAYAEKSDLIADEDSFTQEEIAKAKKYICDLGQEATDKTIALIAGVLRLHSQQQSGAGKQDRASKGSHRAAPTLEQLKKEYTKKGGPIEKLKAVIVLCANGTLAYNHVGRTLNRWQGVFHQNACTLEQLEERVEILTAWRKACDNGTWREFTPKRPLR